MSPTAPTRSPLPGTRPSGTRDPHEAAARVREMFSQIAPRYDLLNHLLSFSFDRLWRRRTARRFAHILARADARVLDLCCGTGDLTLALDAAGSKQARKNGKDQWATVWGSDFAHPMLILAEKKLAGGRGFSRDTSGPPRAGASTPEARVRISFIEADALALPFPDASFDLVTSAFGFRNLANYETGLGEMLRILKGGGEAGVLEFCEPTGRIFRPLYRFYFEKVLPRIGGAISGSPAAYAYLPDSVSKFPSPDELSILMCSAGFADVRYECWTAGTVALHIARRP